MSLLEGIKLPQSSTLALSAGACVASGLITGLIIKKAFTSSTDTVPEKWIKVGEITDLQIYPVKSLQGVSVKEAVLANMGLKGADNPLLRDRVFVIVNEQGVAISNTKFPMLALLRVQIDGNMLQLSHVNDPSIQDLIIDIPGENASSTAVATVMREQIKGTVDCGDAVSDWLNKVTGTAGMRLLYHAKQESQREVVKRNSKFHTYRKSHTGSFQDETSYLVMTEESLAALNEHLKDQPVSHKNFRPTIVVGKIPEPFAEDFWGFIRIGQGNDAPIMKTSLPCQRCKSTTMDPETGIFRTDGEPLRTLYNELKRPVGDEKVTKLVSKAAILGAHFGVFQGEGSVVRVGDPVYAALL